MSYLKTIYVFFLKKERKKKLQREVARARKATKIPKPIRMSINRRKKKRKKKNNNLVLLYSQNLFIFAIYFLLRGFSHCLN